MIDENRTGLRKRVSSDNRVNANDVPKDSHDSNGKTVQVFMVFAILLLVIPFATYKITIAVFFDEHSQLILDQSSLSRYIHTLVTMTICSLRSTMMNQSEQPAPSRPTTDKPVSQSTLSSLIESINAAATAEAMQDLIQQPTLLQQSTDFLRQIGVRSAHQVRPKMLLSAMLICKFPETLFGEHPSGEEENLIIMARVLHECLVGFEQGEIASEECLKAFFTYKSTFETWQRGDRPALIDSLIARYVDLADAIVSLDKQSSTDSHAVRQQMVDMQKQVMEKLERVGGAKAVQRLEEALSRRDPVAAIHMQVPSVPVAALVHEVCFNRHFELPKLIEEYNGPIEMPNAVINSEKDILSTIQFLRTTLLPIIPTGTSLELQVHLDEDTVKAAIQGNRFDFKAALEVAVKVMANSCAPIRDEDVAGLARLLAENDLNKSVSKLIHIVELMKLDFYSYALCQQRPILLNSIVDYEKKYFASVKFDRARSFASAYPDWSEWPFLPGFEEIESVQLDRRRVRQWRQHLMSILIDTAYETIMKKSNVSKEAIKEDNQVVLVLRKRLQAAIKEAVQSGQVRSKEAQRQDGFGIKESVILFDMLQEIQHFMRLHLAIHSDRYWEH